MSPDLIAAVIAFFPYLWLLAEDGWLDDHNADDPDPDPLFGPDIFGADTADALTGTAFGEQVFGGLGDDTISGLAGPDLLLGQDGNDQLDGGIGADTLDGGSGDDQLDGDAGDDRLFGGLGTDLLDGDEGKDLVQGGQGNDTLFGRDGEDTLLGGGGADNLNAGAGADILRDADAATSFEVSADTLTGGDGDDVLYFAPPDVATGGAGADSFILDRAHAGTAVITDFDLSEDLLIIEHDGGSVPTIAGQVVNEEGLSLSLDNGVELILTGLDTELAPDGLVFLDTTT